MELIATDPFFENISDIIFLLDRHDKLRELEDPELKRAVFTIVQEIIDNGIAKPIFGYSPTGPMPDPIPERAEEVLNYLDKYWGKPTDQHNDIGRAYLIFFAKKDGDLEHNSFKAK
ncbi:hypothetical protein [Dyadobacter psychrotolerans]|uniref:Uncharacterized protein n=1 Tax=Dyadobacter psychrotolerans TaxID=2541721 RepID=A0A4R5DH04_9BACT|nr:hypothetical protein [Dyadobacter psychrotolerans]TDE10015.1 hypothetical protein E0F88_29250 [Dyadobacter psychrotolerans]